MDKEAAPQKSARQKIVFWGIIALILVFLFLVVYSVKRYRATKQLLNNVQVSKVYRQITYIQNKLNDLYMQRNFIRGSIKKLEDQILDLKTRATLENMAQVDARVREINKQKENLLKKMNMLNAQIEQLEAQKRRAAKRLPKNVYKTLKKQFALPEFEKVESEVKVSEYPETGVLYVPAKQETAPISPDEKRLLQKELELKDREKKLRIKEQLFYSKLDLLKSKIDELKALSEQLQAKDLRLKIREKDLEQREIEIKAREKIYEERMANYLAMLNSLNEREKALREKERSLKDLEHLLQLKVEGFADAKKKLIEMANKIVALENENRFLRAKLARTEPTSKLVQDLIKKLKAKELELMDKEDALYRKVQIMKLREQEFKRIVDQFNLLVDRYNKAVSP